MSKKLEKLSKEQEDALPRYYKKWLDIGLSTKEGDEAEANRLIKKHYKDSGFKEPETVLFFDNPLDAGLLAAFGKQRYSELENKGDKNAVQKSYEDTLAAYQDGSYKDKVSKDQIEFDGFGQFDAHWLGYYDFFINETDVEIDNRVQNLIELANHSSFYWAFEKMFIAVRKVKELHLEDEKLHNLFGPAIVFPDGFSIYALEGQQLPKKEWEEKTKPYQSSLAKTVFKKV